MESLVTIISVLLIFIKTLVVVLLSFVGVSFPQQNIQVQTVESQELQKRVALKQPPATHVLPEATFISQSFNNCGPASLSMLFSMYDKNVSQEELAQKMRPFNSPEGGVDDKSVFPDEFVSQAEKYGFNALHRPNGNIQLLKKLVANDIPVIVRTWLNPQEDIGHFRIVRGYNEEEQMIIQDDSYQGKNLSYSYDEFNAMWQPFNYGYILVYPKDKQAMVTAILGDEKNERVAWQNSIDRAQKDISDQYNVSYGYFNIAAAQYYLGNYDESIKAYEKAAPGLPARMLWYQLEPIRAYKQIGDHNRVLQLSDAILSNGNEAYSELYQMKGEIYLAQGNKDQARNEFEKAVYYNEHFEAAKKALEKIRNI